MLSAARMAAYSAARSVARDEPPVTGVSPPLPTAPDRGRLPPTGLTWGFFSFRLPLLWLLLLLLLVVVVPFWWPAASWVEAAPANTDRVLYGRGVVSRGPSADAASPDRSIAAVAGAGSRAGCVSAHWQQMLCEGMGVSSHSVGTSAKRRGERQAKQRARSRIEQRRTAQLVDCLHDDLARAHLCDTERLQVALVQIRNRHHVELLAERKRNMRTLNRMKEGCRPQHTR